MRWVRDEQEVRTLHARNDMPLLCYARPETIQRLHEGPSFYSCRTCLHRTPTNWSLNCGWDFGVLSQDTAMTLDKTIIRVCARLIEFQRRLSRHPKASRRLCRPGLCTYRESKFGIQLRRLYYYWFIHAERNRENAFSASSAPVADPLARELPAERVNGHLGYLRVGTSQENTR
jgi:hypothetical protein